MSADRPGRAAGDEEVAFRPGERGILGGGLGDLERPFDPVPPRRRLQFAPRPRGIGPQLPLDLLGGQPLDPGAEGDLAGEGQAGQVQQLVVFDKDAVQPRTPSGAASRAAVSIAARFSEAASSGTTTRSIGPFMGPDPARDQRPGGASARRGLGKLVEPRGDAVVERARRVVAVGSGAPAGIPVSNSRPWSTVSIGMIAKLPGRRRVDDVVAQHQVLDVAGRDDDALAGR